MQVVPKANLQVFHPESLFSHSRPIVLHDTVHSNWFSVWKQLL